MRKFLSLLIMSLAIFIIPSSVSALVPPPDTVKVSFIGDCGVGKTSVVSKMLHDVFRKFTTPTIGSAFESTVLSAVSNGGKNIRLDIWDTAGQERFHALVPMYTRDSDLVVIMYSVDNEKSKDNVSYWYNKISDISFVDPKKIMLVENKIDLTEMRNNNVSSMVEQFGFYSGISTSALTGEGVEELKDMLVELGSKIVGERANDRCSFIQSNSGVKSCCK